MFILRGRGQPVQEPIFYMQRILRQCRQPQILLGIYCFIFEFSNSGGGVFGIVDNSTKSNTRKDNTVSALQALDLNFGTS